MEAALVGLINILTVAVEVFLWGIGIVAGLALILTIIHIIIAFTGG